MAKLIVNPTSPTRRETVLPRSRLSIGRDPSNDLVLPDAMVSRRHAVVEYAASRYTLRDCNSSNGSLVNGNRVYEHVLRDGDTVAIGTARLLFRDDAVAVDASGKVLRHPSARRAECPECHVEFRVGDVYCGQCGHQLEELASRECCSACGAVLRRPARFCSACGEPLPEADRPAGDEARPDEQATPVAGVDLGAATALPKHRSQLSTQVVPALPPPLPQRPSPEPRPQARARRAPVRAALRPAELWPRALAGVIDLVGVAAGQAALLAPLVYSWSSRDASAEVAFAPVLLSVLAVLATLLAGAGYFVYFWGVRGATPGKRLLGLAVAGADGELPIGVPRAAVRTIGYAVSGLFLGVGFLMIVLDGEGLHDRIAGTRVVKRGRS